MLNINDITIEKLERGVLEKDLPEFYELKTVYEKNRSHDETTFEHVLMVMDEYRRFKKNLNNKDMSDYLNEKIDSKTKKDLLWIVFLLHDIAKKETIVKADDSTTSFPKHEKLGKVKARKILERFELTDIEKKYVLEVIDMH